ncbi:MAG: molybdenum cofactor biosynthesis protein MoaE [Sphingomonas sp.]|uniref:molybdenum cofactor biosynthesis protein MoaE n=1 Tax=Sphingomonas sp. TaxID=28214 RepID=UPI0017BF32A8|nr:molybdenum cofactor biosynthesis protein MoaE [Sphingomonas sp.]MBA3666715.1 molybdenum cofactor biosynthesis protein MoaE [Sphingomonas sp.]
MIRLCAEPFDPARELAAFACGAAGAGAVASFTGYVRGEGEEVQALELGHHPRLTPASLTAVEVATRERFANVDLLIIHRHGRLLPGEPIVLVAAAAGHRRAAFDAVDYAMDRLKTEAVFWKKEVRGDGDRWVDARAEDRADRRRWEVADG